MGKYEKAEPLYRQAMEIRKQTLGEKDYYYAISLMNLAALYDNMGDYAKAEPLYRQALEIRRQTLGEKHPDYANSLAALGGLYKEMGSYERPSPFIANRWKFASRRWGKTSDLRRWPDQSGVFVPRDGRLREGRAPLSPSLEIRKQALGEKHADYASSLVALALLYDDMGNYAKAEPLLLQAIEIYKQTLGERTRPTRPA